MKDSDDGLTVSTPVVVTAGFTVRVKLCEAFGVMPLVAANVIENVPLTVGVPLSTPVEVLNVTPAGSVPVSPRVGVGVPVAIIMNVPAVPTVKVVLLALVIAGAWFAVTAGFTVRVKDCVALGVVPLAAVNVIGKLPLAVGVPLNVPVEAVNVTPPGSVPELVSVGAGVPVAVTLNVPAVPTVKVVLLALVIAGAWFTVGAGFTVRVKDCVALGVVPLAAVIVMGKLPLAVGVPLSVPVEAVNVTPPGSAPDAVSVGAGDPVAVTLNVPAVPTVKAVLFALVIDGAVPVAAAGVMTWLLEKLGLWPPPATYSTTLPTFVAGGVQLNVQDVVSTVEKTNWIAPTVDTPLLVPAARAPAWALPLCVNTSSSYPPDVGIVTVIGTAAPPGVYELGAVSVTPLPAVSVPWQLAQVPCPGELVLFNGGLDPNA